MFLVLLLYIIAASTFTISKAGLSYTQPLFFCAARLLGAGAVLYFYERLFGDCSVVLHRADWWLFGVLMLTQSYLGYAADLWALQYMSSVASAFLYNLSPFLTAIFSYILFFERLTLRQLIGLLIGFASMIPVLMVHNPAELPLSIISFTHQTSFSWPELLMLISVAASAFGWVLIRKLLKQRQYTVGYLNSISMLGGGFLALLTSFVIEPWRPLPVSNISGFITYTILMIIIAHLIFFNFYGYLLRKYTATFLSFAGFTASLWAALFGWFFLGEAITWHFFASAITVIIGLYLFYKDELAY